MPRLTIRSALLVAWFGIPVAAATPARADVADSHTLLVTEQGVVDFAVSVNGIPVVERHGVALASVPYFLESYLKDGRNDVEVTVKSATASLLDLVLTAPATNPDSDGATLGHVRCGSSHAGSAPACAPMQHVHFSIDRHSAPALRLWHADAVSPDADAAVAIARSLAGIRADLMRDAGQCDWPALFAASALRGTDLQAAGGSARQVEAQMAKFMDAAMAAHPGVITAAPAPRASDLTLTPLPGHLVDVTRRDGDPAIHVQLGNGAVPGSDHVATIDPRDSGDYADRFITGIFELHHAIYGRYGGTWRLIR